MSYSKQYVRDVYYSGSETVHYPASENGGWTTVHYSGTVPVSVNLYVDTDLFDESVDGTNRELAVVAGAVTATEAAQVAEIRRASKQISQTAIHGFFQVIASEFSAQASEFSSSMKSCVGLLTEEGRQVEGIHRQMETDYQAIKSRYARIFSELDRELDRRIHELDRPAFQLSTHGMEEVVQDPYRESAAKAATQSEDMGSVPLKLMCARAKGRVADALDNLGEVCSYLAEYSTSVGGIMDDANGEGYVFLPVVYTLQQDIDVPNQRIVVHRGEMGQDKAITQRTIAGVATMPEEKWTAPKRDDQRYLDQGFLRCLAEYGAGEGEGRQEIDRQRVSECIMRLYRQTQVETAYAE